MAEKKILIAVDLQNDFIDGALGTKEAEAIVPAAAARIREWREAGAEIFATLDTMKQTTWKPGKERSFRCRTASGERKDGS